ncbi:MAG: 16S rRNA (adenine(1518)-N(6)/adenine(1519)-N(6))-dimethyltransferase RsmA [Candidatus Bathyarchaeia archaeon]
MDAISLLEATKFLLRKHRIFPKKSLGQHFLVNSSIFQLLAAYGSLNSADVVLDIGAGLGFLTCFLAGKCKSVLAVESDARLVNVLKVQVRDFPNVKVVCGDILKAELPQFNKVVSVPPYNISSPLLLWLCNKQFECAVLVFQKEFARRLLASVGSEDYSWLTVVAYYCLEVEILDDVPRWMFYPQPKVDSVIVRLKPKKPPPFTLKNEAFFRRLTQALFTSRNRKVKSAVLPLIKVKEAVKKIENLPFYNKRVRELPPEDFGVLANALAD